MKKLIKIWAVLAALSFAFVSCDNGSSDNTGSSNNSGGNNGGNTGSNNGGGNNSGGGNNNGGGDSTTLTNLANTTWYWNESETTTNRPADSDPEPEPDPDPTPDPDPEPDPDPNPDPAPTTETIKKVFLHITSKDDAYVGTYSYKKNLNTEEISNESWKLSYKGTVTVSNSSASFEWTAKIINNSWARGGLSINDSDTLLDYLPCSTYGLATNGNSYSASKSALTFTKTKTANDGYTDTTKYKWDVGKYNEAMLGGYQPETEEKLIAKKWYTNPANINPETDNRSRVIYSFSDDGKYTRSSMYKYIDDTYAIFSSSDVESGYYIVSNDYLAISHKKDGGIEILMLKIGTFDLDSTGSQTASFVEFSNSTIYSNQTNTNLNVTKFPEIKGAVSTNSRVIDTSKKWYEQEADWWDDKATPKTKLLYDSNYNKLIFRTEETYWTVSQPVPAGFIGTDLNGTEKKFDVTSNGNSITITDSTDSSLSYTLTYVTRVTYEDTSAKAPKIIDFYLPAKENSVFQENQYATIDDGQKTITFSFLGYKTIKEQLKDAKFVIETNKNAIIKLGDKVIYSGSSSSSRSIMEFFSYRETYNLSDGEILTLTSIDDNSAIAEYTVKIDFIPLPKITYDPNLVKNGFDETDADFTEPFAKLENEFLATEKFVIPEPTVEGYKFGGWYTDEDMTEANKVTALNETANTTTSDITLYSKWTAQDVQLKIKCGYITDAKGNYANETKQLVRKAGSKFDFDDITKTLSKSYTGYEYYFIFDKDDKLIIGSVQNDETYPTYIKGDGLTSCNMVFQPVVTMKFKPGTKTFLDSFEQSTKSFTLKDTDGNEHTFYEKYFEKSEDGTYVIAKYLLNKYSVVTGKDFASDVFGILVGYSNSFYGWENEGDPEDVINTTDYILQGKINCNGKTYVPKQHY